MSTSIVVNDDMSEERRNPCPSVMTISVLPIYHIISLKNFLRPNLKFANGHCSGYIPRSAMNSKLLDPTETKANTVLFK